MTSDHLGFPDTDNVPERVENVSKAVKNLGIGQVCRFHLVESDYYNWPLEQRANALNAPSIENLCKTILFQNTRVLFND
jgi:hypothetical protein